MPKRFVLAALPLYSDMTGLYCFFLLLTNFRDDGMLRFALFPYLVMGFVSVLINLLLASKERTLLSAALANGIMVAVFEVVLFLLSPALTGLLPLVLAFIIFAWPPLRGWALVLKSPPASTMLLYCELAILGTGAFLITQVSDFSPGAAPNILCLIAIALNLATLSYLRGLGAVQTQGQQGSRRARVFILLAAALLLVGATLVLGLILMPGTAGAIISAAVAVKDGFVWVAVRVWQWVEYLFSLLPGSDITAEAGALNLPQEDFGGADDIGPAQIPEWLPYLLIALAAAAVFVVVVIVLVKIGKRRLRLQAAAIDTGEEKSHTPSLAGLLAAALQKLWGRILFYRLLLARWNTAPGLMVRLELRGRRCGCPRQGNHTPREFLTALSSRTEDPAAHAGFESLAGQIDRLCFGGASPPVKIFPPAEQVRAMMRVTRPRRAQRKDRPRPETQP